MVVVLILLDNCNFNQQTAKRSTNNGQRKNSYNKERKRKRGEVFTVRIGCEFGFNVCTINRQTHTHMCTKGEPSKIQLLDCCLLLGCCSSLARLLLGCNFVACFGFVGRDWRSLVALCSIVAISKMAANKEAADHDDADVGGDVGC